MLYYTLSKLFLCLTYSHKQVIVTLLAFASFIQKCFLVYLTQFIKIDSQSSDIIFEDSSSDEINTNMKQDSNLLYDSSSHDNELAYSASSLRKIENMLPYYLLSFSYRISGHVSYMLQKLFIQNEYSRVYILEQISYIIKQEQGSSGTMPDNIVVM